MFLVALKLIPDNELYRSPFVSIGAFAPALVSIFLSRSGERDNRLKKKRRTTFLCVAYG
jgi:hypothetical protein